MIKATIKIALTLFCSTLLGVISLQATANGGLGKGGPKPMKIFPPERIGSYALTIAESGDEAEVYFPLPKTSGKGGKAYRFPIVLISQGAKVDKEYYSMLAATVARHGFIVVVPNQRNALFGNTLRYAEMTTIYEVLEQFRTEDISPDSPVYGIADTSKLALMGHSFGGASTILAAAGFCGFPFCDMSVGFVRPAELKAVVLTSSHSGSLDLDTTDIPVAIIGGSEESARTRQLATYQTLEPPKAFVTVVGANHYGMCDANVPPGASPIDGESDQTLPQSISVSRYGYWAGTFLRAHVYNDQQAARRIFKPVPTPGVTVISQKY